MTAKRSRSEYQAKYQRELIREGRCRRCGKKRGKSKSRLYCKACHEMVKVADRERKRK